jgi:hypothetical protein
VTSPIWTHMDHLAHLVNSEGSSRLYGLELGILTVSIVILHHTNFHDHPALYKSSRAESHIKSISILRTFENDFNLERDPFSR